jgi:hypothetical protein
MEQAKDPNPEQKQATAVEDLAVPAEVREMFERAIALTQCRDECIRSVFKARRAIYYAEKAVRTNNEAWRLVKAIWPQTTQGVWGYNHGTMRVYRVA